jgi:hypothetical protein
MKKKWLKKGLVIGIFFLFLVTVYHPSATSTQNMTSEKNNNNVYYTYDELTSLLIYLQSKYPNIFSIEILGKTNEGRDLWLVKISDNVTMDEAEPAVLYSGGIHGNEDPGYQVVIYSLKAIVENYTHVYVNESFTNRIRNIVNTTELYFIPMLNPDGIEAHTRKNRRLNDCPLGKTLLLGVDIHRNFDFNWDDVFKHPFRYIAMPRSLDDLKKITSQKFLNLHLFERTCVIYPFLDCASILGSGMYRGPYAFSENETQAVRSVFENHTITISVDYHIFGESIYFPKLWNSSYANPSDKITFWSIAQNISKINNYTWSSKKLLEWLNSSGTFGAWAYTTHNCFSFGIELCGSMLPSYFPDKVEILKLCDTHLLVNLYLAERVQKMDDIT